MHFRDYMELNKLQSHLETLQSHLETLHKDTINNFVNFCRAAPELNIVLTVVTGINIYMKLTSLN